MSWIMDGFYEHEGWAASVVRDGREAAGSSGAGVLIGLPDVDERVRRAHAAGRVVGNDDMYETIPYEDVVAWVARCQCGWVGRRWERSATLPGEYGGADPGDAHLPDGSTVEEQARRDWAAHLEPLDRLAAIRTAAAAFAQARERLDQAVAQARASEPALSWADIGQAAGMSRQSAHERWGIR